MWKNIILNKKIFYSIYTLIFNYGSFINYINIFFYFYFIFIFFFFIFILFLFLFFLFYVYINFYFIFIVVIVIISYCYYIIFFWMIWYVVFISVKIRCKKTNKFFLLKTKVITARSLWKIIIKIIKTLNYIFIMIRFY